MKKYSLPNLVLFNKVVSSNCLLILFTIIVLIDSYKLILYFYTRTHFTTKISKYTGTNVQFNK